MLEPKFKIGDVVYFYIDDCDDDYYLYKHAIGSVTISAKGVTYKVNYSERGSFQPIDENDLFLDLESCKTDHIERRIQTFREKIDLVPYLAEEIKLTDFTQFKITEEEQAHNN